jgi:hypothetical protein
MPGEALPRRGKEKYCAQDSSDHKATVYISVKNVLVCREITQCLILIVILSKRSLRSSVMLSEASLSFDCHPEQAFVAQQGIWASRAKRRVCATQQSRVWLASLPNCITTPSPASSRVSAFLPAGREPALSEVEGDLARELIRRTVGDILF